MREVICSDPACNWPGQRVEHVSEVLNTCPVCRAGTLFSKLPIGERPKANHQDITAWGSVTYWRFGHSATSADEWTEASIVVNPNNGVDAFRVNSRTSLDNYKWVLDRAFEAGRAAKTAEIRNVLEITK